MTDRQRSNFYSQHHFRSTSVFLLHRPCSPAPSILLSAESVVLFWLPERRPSYKAYNDQPSFLSFRPQRSSHLRALTVRMTLRDRRTGSIPYFLYHP